MDDRWKSNRGLKVFLVVVSLLAAVVTVCSGIAVAIFGVELEVYEKTKEEAMKGGFDRYSDIYSVMALAWQQDEERLRELSETNFRYGIVRAEDIDAVDISDPASYMSYNFETMPEADALGKDEVRAVKFTVGPNTMLSWDCQLFGYCYTYESAEDYAYAESVYDEPIIGYYYNVADGFFYYETEDAYYRVDTVELPVGVSEEFISFVYDPGQKTYYNMNREMCTVKDYYLTFDRFDDMGCSWETWNSVNLDGRTFQHTDIRFADDEMTKETDMFNGKPIAKQFYQTNGDGMLMLKADEEAAKEKVKERESYWVISQVKEPLVETGIRGDYLDGDLYEQITVVLNYAYAWRYPLIVILVVSVILWGVSTLLALMAAGHKGYYEEFCGDAERADSEEPAEEAQKRWVDAIRPGFWQKIPLEVESCILIVPAMMLFVVGMEMFTRLSSPLDIVVPAVCLTGTYLLCYIWLADFVIRVKAGMWWRTMLCYRFFTWIWRKAEKVLRSLLGVLRLFRENLSLLWKAVLVLGGLCLLEFFGILVTEYAMQTEIAIWLLYRMVTVALILLGILQANKLKEGAKRLAEGNLSEKVKTDKMFWEFKEHGETLNRVNDGISLAVEKRMQSEHFRTELITNVSHDIKTPLTSIINYVDLLQKEEIDNERAKEYLEVLSRQSARLKKLTEDLVEASKASTGSISVQMEKLELGVFLTQTVGEFEERFEAAGLHTVMHKPETEIFVMADGRHLWRVVENLVQNICKYAQPDTRVYIDLDEWEREAVIFFKNVSRYELNISGEALMERFVRGDASRHTEGSGLGLSIAGSLMELMGGKLEIVVDGDLFKVVLHFPK